MVAPVLLATTALTAAESIFAGGFDNLAVTFTAALAAWVMLQL
jgi:hypothetical protein